MYSLQTKITGYVPVWFPLRLSKASREQQYTLTVKNVHVIYKILIFCSLIERLDLT